jgi:hypothetical protein
MFAIRILSISLPFFQVPYSKVGESKEHGFRFVTIDVEPSPAFGQAFEVNVVALNDVRRELFKEGNSLITSKTGAMLESGASRERNCICGWVHCSEATGQESVLSESQVACCTTA